MQILQSGLHKELCVRRNASRTAVIIRGIEYSFVTSGVDENHADATNIIHSPAGVLPLLDVDPSRPLHRSQTVHRPQTLRRPGRSIALINATQLCRPIISRDTLVYLWRAVNVRTTRNTFSAKLSVLIAWSTRGGRGVIDASNQRDIVTDSPALSSRSRRT